MSEIVLAKFRIKPGKKKTWLNWCAQLKKRKNEVLKTLKTEGVTIEACFLSQNQKHIYYFMQAKSINRAKHVAQKSNYKIDSEHKKKRKLSLKKVELLKELFHFESK